MEERPILFNAEMVNAILKGGKTQTRRVAKLTAAGHVKEVGGHRRWHTGDVDAVNACPYGVLGDRLWVRETWAYGTHALAVSNYEQEGPWVYAADDAATQGRLCDRWRPSIHMFRAASRITLEITGVRIERLNGISRGDAMSEGCPFVNMACGPDPRLWYAGLWEEINGHGSWNVDPLVWVVEFKRLEGDSI